jgi:AcrR family transcriptional regulator
MDVKSWQRQQADRTREQLLQTARGVFIEKGYAATSLEEVVSRAGMTRGALYHHFKDKRALFDAVVERAIEEMGDRVAAVSKALVARQAKHKSHPDRYLQALAVLLDELGDPATRRLVLMDGPVVLGRERLGHWLRGHVFPVIRRVIQTRSEAGLVPPHLVEPLSHLIIGAVQEAALTIGEAADPRRARRDLLEAFLLIADPILAAPGT